MAASRFVPSPEGPPRGEAPYRFQAVRQHARPACARDNCFVLERSLWIHPSPRRHQGCRSRRGSRGAAAPCSTPPRCFPGARRLLFRRESSCRRSAGPADREFARVPFMSQAADRGKHPAWRIFTRRAGLKNRVDGGEMVPTVPAGEAYAGRFSRRRPRRRVALGSAYFLVGCEGGATIWIDRRWVARGRHPIPVNRSWHRRVATRGEGDPSAYAGGSPAPCNRFGPDPAWCGGARPLFQRQAPRWVPPNTLPTRRGA